MKPNTFISVFLLAAVLLTTDSSFARTPDAPRGNRQASEQRIEELQRNLQTARKRLDEARERIRAKFAPAPADDPDLLWGKMLRFRSVGMQDDASKALAFLRQKHSPDFLPGAIDVADALCRLGPDAPTIEGVMVSSYEPPATSHAIFRPGDIVVARDGLPVRRSDNWKTNIGSRYRFWRLDTDGKFQLHEAVLPAGQPRVGLVNIAEEGAADMLSSLDASYRQMQAELEQILAIQDAELKAIQDAQPDYRALAKARDAAEKGPAAYAAELKALANAISANLRAAHLTAAAAEQLLATLSAIDDISDTVQGGTEAQFGLLETIADTARNASPEKVAHNLETQLRLVTFEESLRNADLPRAQKALGNIHRLASRDDMTATSLDFFQPALLLLQGHAPEALQAWDAFISAQRASAHGAPASAAGEQGWTPALADLLADMQRHGVDVSAFSSRIPGL